MSQLVLKLQDAERMAAAVDDMVRRSALDARSLLADARLDYGKPFSQSTAQEILSARPEVARSEPVAWLYTCFKPGHQEVFASVSEDDSTHWPLDQWTKVTKVPLFAESPLARKPDADPA